MIDYSPMWEYMRTHNISQYYLLKHSIDNKTIYNLKRNENITILTLEKLCKAMGCKPNDIVKFVDKMANEKGEQRLQVQGNEASSHR